MHSAEGIVTWLGDARIKDSQNTTDLLENCLDAAQTVLYCAQHQKSIVDDILTLSKLDSKLLLITPVLSYPVSIIKHTLKMFEVQLSTFNIECHFNNNLPADNVGRAFLLDPSRLMQILINLVTNAIKFTKNEATRKVTVTLGASLTRPTASAQGIEYFPMLNPVRTTESAGDVFLQLAVADTGCGLRSHEKEDIFRRFAQASPRTHVQYGGSGLGLFICRKIVEMHNGQIGVASRPTGGSTFAFYITAQRPSSEDVPGAEVAIEGGRQLSGKRTLYYTSDPCLE